MKLEYTKPFIRKLPLLHPQPHILNKYFDYDDKENRRQFYINTKNDTKKISDEAKEESFKELHYFNRFDLVDIEILKEIFLKYNIEEHLDNLLFESFMFRWAWEFYHYRNLSKEYGVFENLRLNLMHLIVKYGIEREKVYHEEIEKCSLELKFIKRDRTEKIIIDESNYYFTNEILNLIRGHLVDNRTNMFPPDLFPDYSLTQDKTKQLKFIDENLIKPPKGRKNKNLILAKFIVNILDYLNNETPLKSANNKVISNKQAVFIYDFFTYKYFIIPPPIELINEDKAMYVRDILSNFKSKQNI